MPKIVAVPNVGNVEFPDSMSDDEVSAAIRKSVAGPQAEPLSNWQKIKNAAGDFAAGVGKEINPVTMAAGARDLAYNAVTHPIDTVGNMLRAQSVPVAKAIDAAKAGDYIGAARHAAGAMIPLAGPAIDEMGDEAQNGQMAHALGRAAGFGVVSALPGSEAGNAIASKFKSVPVLPKIANATPKEGAALDYLAEKGVPVSAGARTGSAYVKHVQKLVDSTPLGAVVTHGVERDTTNALRAESADLTQRAAPPTPASELYGKFRDAEADPANLRTVQTGTKSVADPNPDLDASGYPIAMPEKSVAVTEKMPIPVEVGKLKAQLQPIFDEMQWMPAADRNASAGYRAIENILKGPDHVPASVAELGLSGIKALGRESSGRTQGLAKFVTPKLQELIDQSVADATPGAADALKEGRTAAAAEMGHKWLTDTFDKATAEGGFNKQATLWNRWQQLSDADKSSMFRNPQHVQDLDKFFLGAKKIAENPNPSGSGVYAGVGGLAGLIFTHPATGIPMTLGAGALAKMLHSPRGVAALTDGLKVSGTDGVVRGMAAARVLKLAGDAAQPMPLPLAAAASPSPQTAEPTLTAAMR